MTPWLWTSILGIIRSGLRRIKASGLVRSFGSGGRSAAGDRVGGTPVDDPTPAAEVAREIDGWVEAEMRPWRQLTVPPQEFDAALARSLEDDPSVFRFNLRGGQVTFVEKSMEQCRLGPERHLFYMDLLTRGSVYRNFLQAVVTAHGIRGTADLLIDLEDLSDHPHFFPVFRFQKVSESQSILLPDVELLDHEFYVADLYEDDRDFVDKADQALFVGSTTGLDVSITCDIVDRLDHPRLRSAMFFKRSSDVLFELPNIVQCDSPETEARIRALDIGGARRSWPEQLGYRYLISIDGNGATCSRVAISLKSNSVLIRYHSMHVLYFFHGLRSWTHYIPVNRDADVVASLALLRRDQTLAASIASASAEFFRTRLSRIAVMHYTAGLLRAYASMFGRLDDAGAEEPVFAVDSFARVAGKGVVWARPNDWFDAPDGQLIDSIVFVPGPDIAPADLVCRLVHAAAPPAGTAGGRQPRGAADGPLSGFVLELRGAAARRYTLQYQARFADGSEVGPVPAGTPCVAASGARLTAYRLIVRRRR